MLISFCYFKIFFYYLKVYVSNPSDGAGGDVTDDAE
jgi:hypothetical protein